MNIDIKKMAIRFWIWVVVFIVGIYILFSVFGFKDWSIIAENRGILVVGAFIGIMASYVHDIFPPDTKQSK